MLCKEKGPGICFPLKEENLRLPSSAFCRFAIESYTLWVPEARWIRSLNFPCVLCPVPQPAFKSSKSLESHKRVVHGCRSNMRFYAPESGICYACQTNFNSRLRLLAHQVDSRRLKCRDTILQSNFPNLPESEVQRLDICDRTYRRIAKRAGLTCLLLELRYVAAV